jgi:toxin HigB-1
LCYTLQFFKNDPKFSTQRTATFFETGNKSGIQALHADKLRLQLAALNNAVKPEDMSAPSWRLHALQGHLKMHWAITVRANWRLTFTFEDQHAVLVNYLDYH